MRSIVRCDPGKGRGTPLNKQHDARRIEVPSPQPSPRKNGEREKSARSNNYGSSRLAFASLNHLWNIASVSIISVKPAWLIFTVETIDGGPDSVCP
ncbi:hypothetical protein ABIF38_002825 [Bradyrhizobium japonicum]|uniref:Uncharacterized protein n=1 Tax=Bradyrhizobium elkanii TaxID=29448 RepID=A0ABV4FBL1_BRAEL